MSKIAAFVVAALALGAAVGFLAGRRNGAVPPTASPRDREAAVLRQRLALAEARLQDVAAEKYEEIRNRIDTEAPMPEESEAFPIEKTLRTVHDLVAAIEGMAGNPELFRQDVLDFVQDRLLAELRDNPAALAWALEKFRSNPDSEGSGMLAVVLGQLQDPEVEATALALARQGSLAGLDLLDRLDIENPETQRAVLDLLRTGDARILAGSIYALHRGTPDPTETREALSTLTPLASHSDAEVRRRAILAIAEWAPDAASLDPVIRALQDSSVDVRAGAAFALSQARLLHPSTVDSLAARIADEREDWTVRDLAWQALARMPLDERAHAIVKKFGAERDAANEVREEAHEGCAGH